MSDPLRAFAHADLAAQMAWVGSVPPALVRFIGAAELAGAIGLILPALTRFSRGSPPWPPSG